MVSDSPNIDVVALLVRLSELRSEVATARMEGLDALASTWRPSAENLVRYLALRHQDLRDLQRELSVLGLSSLGRSEADVAHTLARVEEASRRSFMPGSRRRPLPTGAPSSTPTPRPSSAPPPRGAACGS